MKKSFPLTESGHKPARVIEMIHRDVRKYIKRERRKSLPEGTDFWDFDCRVGGDSESAESVHVATITEAINKAPEKEWTAVYVEILAKPATRTKKAIRPTAPPKESEDIGD